MVAINLDHNKGMISTNDDSIIKIGDRGAIQLGTGEYLEEESDVTIADLVGAIRYNVERKCLQVCDGKIWRDVKGQYKQTSHIVWSLLF